MQSGSTSNVFDVDWSTLFILDFFRPLCDELRGRNLSHLDEIRVTANGGDTEQLELIRLIALDVFLDEALVLTQELQHEQRLKSSSGSNLCVCAKSHSSQDDNRLEAVQHPHKDSERQH